MATAGSIDITDALKGFALQLQPYQLELYKRMTEDLTVGFRRLSVTVTVSSKAMKDFTRVVRWLYFWKDQRRHFQTYGLTRPNGKPRRSGRRHKGMPAWRGHYA